MHNLSTFRITHLTPFTHSARIPATPIAPDGGRSLQMDDFDDFEIGPQADEFIPNEFDTDDLEDIGEDDDTLYDEDEVEDDEEEISRYEDGWEDANEDDFDSFDWDND